MQHSRSRLIIVSTITIAGLAALGACDSPPTTVPAVHASAGHAPAMQAVPVTGEIQRDIARLRARTAAFHRFDAAAAAGWSARITDCFSDPQLGGMGFHYGNPALIDGTVDAAEPELLLYEPRKNGELRFVAVEYIVPFTAWSAAEPPQLYGQSFHRNEGFGLWVLHVWHERSNPRGMFADWNPRVTCEYGG